MNSAILRRLAALSLSPDAMGEVLSIIADIQATDESRRAGQRERSRRSRAKDTSPSRHSNSDQPPLRENNPPSSFANAKDELWTRGRQAICDLGGIPWRQAGSMIGRWLKAKHAAGTILSAIDAAAEAKTRDPIPYITAALQPKVVFAKDWDAGAARQIEERKKEKQISSEEREANLAKLKLARNR